MKLHSKIILTDTDTGSITLFPFACVHRDNEGHSLSHWQEFLREVRETPNAYAIGMGDYHDFLRTHAREWVKAYPHDRNSFKTMEDWRHKETKAFAEELEPIGHQLLGLHIGNHHYEYSTGENDTQELCRLLSVPYLDHTCFTRLTFRRKRFNDSYCTMTMLSLHGEGVGGGSSAGGDINAMINKGSGFDADIVLMAHNHQKNAAETTQLYIPRTGKLDLKERNRVYVRCGCFVKGYVSGCTTYAERNLLKPTAIGYTKIEIKFHKLREDVRTHTFRVTV